MKYIKTLNETLQDDYDETQNHAIMFAIWINRKINEGKLKVRSEDLDDEYYELLEGDDPYKNWLLNDRPLFAEELYDEFLADPKASKH